jgi:DUF4097 and DUF4098 domain-containing protein YvlB
MKQVINSLAVLMCAFGLVASVAGRSHHKVDEKTERTMASDPSVTVTLCVMAGQITVRGWEKDEVRARSADAEEIEFKRIDAAPGETKPARKIDVFIKDGSEEGRARGDCQASADVELDVPKGATVQVQTRDGNISITGIEAAYAGSQNGDICIENVSQRIEAGSIGGGISLKDSSGRVNLSSAGGGIDVTNVKPLTGEDDIEVTSVSGDIQFDSVGHSKLAARSVTGNINLAGPLSHGGNYGFNTTSGDITLSLPSEASFRLMARLSQDGEIITDFPLTLTTEPVPPIKAPPAPDARNAPPPGPAPKPGKPAPPDSAPEAEKPDSESTPRQVTVVKVVPAVKVPPVVVKVAPPVIAIPYSLRRVDAVCGTGDAFINVSSFSGNLRLEKN